MKTDVKRVEWLDFARSVAICAVVLCHAVEKFYMFTAESFMTSNPFFNWFALSLHIFGRLGVPVFLFLSGYLLLGRYDNSEDCIRFWKIKWIPLLITVEVWIVIYNIFLRFSTNSPFNIWELIQNMLFLKPVRIGHTWYLPMILGLYIFVPILSSIVNRFSKEIIIILAILSCFANFVVPSINDFLILKGVENVLLPQVLLDVTFTGGMYALYLLIGYFFRAGYFERVAIWLWAVGFLVFYIITVVFQVWGFSQGVEFLMWYNSLPLLLAALCLFGLFSKMDRIPHYNVIKKISISAFGCYLVHNLIMIIFMKLLSILSIEMNRGIGIILLFFVAGLISFVVVYLVSKVPILGKILFIIKPSNKGEV